MKMDALSPGLLVAVPQLADPNFRQSVVLLLEQNDQGALGVVLNHETSLPLAQLCEDHGIPYQGDPAKCVRRGGPVQPEHGLVLYGAELEDPEGHPVVEGLCVSASRETLRRLCGRRDGRYHCFAGYAGWAPGQLEQEIQEGSWIVVPARAEVALDMDPGIMWSRVLAENGLDPSTIVPGGEIA